MSRHTARENLFKLIYERCINGGKNSLTFNLIYESEVEAQKEYLLSIYEGIDNKFDFLINVINQYSVDFAIDRVYKVDLSILLISIYEMLFLSDIPDVVSINEAVELAKIYSTEKSSVFINGVLAAVKKNKEQILSSREDTTE